MIRSSAPVSGSGAVVRSIRLSPSEAWQVIEGSHTGILTSLRRDGVPISLPVWFVALDRRVYVSGPAHTKKFGRIRRDARVAFLVESGTAWAELVGVHLTGTAREIGDPELLARVHDALDAKYSAFRSDRAVMPARTAQYYETATATIEIEPDERVLTWDNARFFAGDPR
jgi:nitroimidazol reductase NimA-like FMN-containing flavoprotein (pyridoxamine 5'-phosphate oxidase superfamily)